jgi:predicted nucleic-acid-binding protein
MTNGRTKGRRSVCPRQGFVQALEVLLRTQQIIVDRADQVLRALRVFDGGKADFADCLTERTAVSAGCEQIMTFDTGAAKHVGMTLIR